MKRETLKEILLKYYVNSTANSILRGTRKPSYETIVEMNIKDNVPFDIWRDIKSYLKNDTKKSDSESSANNTQEVV